MKITMPRGDCRPFRFKIKNKDGSDSDIVFDDIYITFKEGTEVEEYLFQKRLSKKDITKDDEGYYHFVILPKDTDGLEYAEYYFDIQIYKKEPLIKQTFVGMLKLTEEITFARNEV